MTAELDGIAVANPIAARDAADGRTREVAIGFWGGNWSVVATVPKQRGRRGKNVRGVEQWVTHAVGIVGAQRMEEDAVAAGARARQRDHPPGCVSFTLSPGLEGDGDGAVAADATWREGVWEESNRCA